MNSDTIGIIGGADGPTSIYISGSPASVIIGVAIFALIIIGVIVFAKKRKSRRK